jgi:O-antigen/teichoic acid export membrane protein/2-polyprenyl-3-methyl-5-hydroxy-6-metoxy-1,4-benzoquinol methylase
MKQKSSAQQDQKIPSEQNLERAVTKGALWMILARLGDRSLGVVSTVILVRLLAPADFGLVAMGMSVIAICELLGQVGLDVALIQNPNTTRRHYDTAWTFSVILAIVIALILVLVAGPAAKFYGEARLVPILLALAAGSLISGFENIGIVAFRKELQFNKEFLFFFGKKLAAFLITVPLAIMFRSYWALISGIVGGRLAAVCLSYYVQEYRPRWSLAARRDLFHFSKWMAGSNFVSVLNTRAADFIVGKVAGAHALGVFNVSYEVSNLPTSELIAPINRAVFPGYARKSADVAALRQVYLNVIGVIATFGIPAGVGIAATADWFVPLLFGQQWIEAIPLVSILAFYGILATVKTNSQYIYLALGKPHLATCLGTVELCLLIAVLPVLTIRYGAIGAAYAYLASQSVFVPISFAVLFKVLGVAVSRLLSVLWRPVVSAALMFAAVRFVTPPTLVTQPLDDATNLISCLAAMITGAVVYTGCLYTLWTVSARPMGAESWFLGAVQSTKLWLWLQGCVGAKAQPTLATAISSGRDGFESHSRERDTEGSAKIAFKNKVVGFLSDPHFPFFLLPAIKRVSPSLARFLRYGRYNPNTENYWNRRYTSNGYEVERYEDLHNQVARLVPPSSRVLDAGCGTGSLMKVLQSLECSCVGVDISSVAVSKVRQQGFSAFKSKLPNLPQEVEENSFDICTIVETLEHLTHPDRVLRNLAKVLKHKSGSIIVSVPDDCMKPEEFDEHVSSFTADTLHKLMSRYYSVERSFSVPSQGHQYLIMKGKRL